ncbi:MAG: zinc-dependent metalloprotease family protein, partial [Candidatus Promineifilaceae bacterium]
GSAAAIRNEIRAAVALTNQRFRDSQIDTVLNLTGFYETPYASTYDTSIDLQRFVDVDDGYMDEIHTLRNAQSADLAALITLRADDGSCGRGNQPSSLSHAWFDTSAFSINPLSFMYTNGQIYSCNMISVVGHEVGHNLSARHDWFVSSGQDSNHGYIDFDRQQRTVMAYSTACIQRNISCPRVDYYSNPDVSLSGGPLGGVQKYHGAYADNAWAINAYRVEAANYRWKNNPPSATGGLVYDSYWLYLQTGHSGAANKQVAKCGAPSYAQLITRNQSLEAQTNVTATLTTTDPYLTIEQDNTTTFADSLSGEVIPAQTYITLYFDVTTPMFHSAMAEVNITSSQGVITNTLAIKANCFPDQNDMHLPIVTNH